MANTSEHEIVMRKNGYPHDGSKPVAEWTREIRIDLGVTQTQDSLFSNLWGNRGPRRKG
jgi:hypothetical protein